jgi:hypothetical protein
MPRHKIWLGKLDEWFASNNIHRMSSLVAKKGAMIAARPTDYNTMQSDGSSTNININVIAARPPRTMADMLTCSILRPLFEQITSKEATKLKWMRIQKC